MRPQGLQQPKQVLPTRGCARAAAARAARGCGCGRAAGSGLEAGCVLAEEGSGRGTPQNSRHLRSLLRCDGQGCGCVPRRSAPAPRHHAPSRLSARRSDRSADVTSRWWCAARHGRRRCRWRSPCRGRRGRRGRPPAARAQAAATARARAHCHWLRRHPVPQTTAAASGFAASGLARGWASRRARRPRQSAATARPRRRCRCAQPQAATGCGCRCARAPRRPQAARPPHTPATSAHARLRNPHQAGTAVAPVLRPRWLGLSAAESPTSNGRKRPGRRIRRGSRRHGCYQAAGRSIAAREGRLRAVRGQAPSRGGGGGCVARKREGGAHKSQKRTASAAAASALRAASPEASMSARRSVRGGGVETARRGACCNAAWSRIHRRQRARRCDALRRPRARTVGGVVGHGRRRGGVRMGVVVGHWAQSAGKAAGRAAKARRKAWHARWRARKAAESGNGAWRSVAKFPAATWPRGRPAASAPPNAVTWQRLLLSQAARARSGAAASCARAQTISTVIAAAAPLACFRRRRAAIASPCALASPCTRRRCGHHACRVRPCLRRSQPATLAAGRQRFSASAQPRSAPRASCNRAGLTRGRARFWRATAKPFRRAARRHNQ
jgi:hypothetical protein